MVQRKSLFLFALILLFHQGKGQSYRQQYNDLVAKKDSVAQKPLLEKWEKDNRNDPELYVAYFNYYVNKSRSEVIALGDNPKGKEALQITSSDSAQSEPVGFIYGEVQYNRDVLNKGFGYISRGIEKNPSRLDMRFGKIYMYGELEDYEPFTTEIIKTIDYSAVNQNQWTWTDNKPVDDPKNFMLGSIQTYIFQLYNTGEDRLLDNMKRISETVLTYYPDHVESLSNVSVVYLIKKEYDKALEPLLKAEKLAPNDYIVLGNIAQAYKLKGDKVKAIKYYELSMKYGDEETKAYAKKQIEELNKN